ncbi:uncharacterized protein ACNLHF_022566 isoform 2-T2 [Anomaloglossus baeobatrachus]|uniref:uncharacterized protein LOC142244310 isoform X1 n=1 Tax=Anomaloglossus baeobatrachus TaxID=238106 RepID=UPI003F50B97F
MEEAARASPGSMEKCVEKFLKSVRFGETVIKTTETGSTEHDLGNQGKASHDAVEKTVMKNNPVIQPPFYCSRKENNLLRIRVGKEYIQKYETPGGILVAKCELCCEQILAVSNHLDSYSHLLAYLKANQPKVFRNVQLRGLNNMKAEELKRIVVEEAFKQCGKLNNPAGVENLFPDQKSGLDEDCEPPQKMARMNNPPCNDKFDTILNCMKEENSDLVQNEKKDNVSDQRQIQQDCQEYLECKTESDLKPNGSESLFKITCNKDLYTFLQYFKISDDTDVKFIQQIVKTFKSQLQEFVENSQQLTTISDINDKDQEESISKLKISNRAESILQHADSTTTSTTNECSANKSARDIKDHCKDEGRTNSVGNPEQCSNMRGRLEDVSTVDHSPKTYSSNVTTAQDSTTTSSANECSANKSARDIKDHYKDEGRTNSVGNPEQCSNMRGRKLEDVSTVDQLPEKYSSKITTAQASNSVSSHHSCDTLCHTTREPLISPSVSTSVLKSHQSIVSVKKEPDVGASVEPQLDSTTATNTKDPMVTATASNSFSSHHSSDTLCPTSKKPLISSSVSTLLKSYHQSIASIKKEPDVDASVEPQLDSTTATNTKDPMVTGSTKAQSHCSMSEFGKDHPPSTSLGSSSSDKNKAVPAAKKPRIDHLNFPTSPSNTQNAKSISFDGKKDINISQLIAEVTKFADTKPVLKGMDINKVVQILIRNRIEKNRKKRQDSSA